MAYEIPRHFYSSALKREAINRVRRDGKALDQVARELGLSTTRLGEWLAAANDLGLMSSLAADSSEIYQDEHDRHPANAAPLAAAFDAIALLPHDMHRPLGSSRLN